MTLAIMYKDDALKDLCRALDLDDWRECRTAYERFAFAESWRG